MPGISAHERPPVPFERSYWVFRVACWPASIRAPRPTKKPSKSWGALLDAGIRCVVNLVEEGETDWGDQPLRSYSGVLMRLAV